MTWQEFFITLLNKSSICRFMLLSTLFERQNRTKGSKSFRNQVAAYGCFQSGIDRSMPNPWNNFQKAAKGQRLSKALLRNGYRQIKCGVGRVARPLVHDSRLCNLIEDLYKGDRMPSVLGNGSTADAIRLEYAVGRGFRFHGADHLNNKGPQYVAAIRKWLAKRGSAAVPSDVTAAKAILIDLNNALRGM
jgi:hypothetical protein